MYDKSLIARLLPSELVIKDFVYGDADCNYEKYLLEFVNASEFFRVKSNGGLYQAPMREDDGQCDCISTHYHMDFKLIASKTVLQARSILCARKTVIAKSITAVGAPVKKDGQIKATRIFAALRDYNLKGLYELRNNPDKKQGVENDIYELLTTLETKKNLLLFFPYEFIFDNKYELDEGIPQIVNALNNDFGESMKYRRLEGSGNDTYIAFIFNENIVFLQECADGLKYVDHVNLKKSPIFQNLMHYCD